jgi:hypothetical protein
MSVPKNSPGGNETSGKPASPKPLGSSGTHRPLLQGPIKARSGGPGQTWLNLTRKDVEARQEKYSQHPATSSGSFWQKLTGLFTKSNKSG